MNEYRAKWITIGLKNTAGLGGRKASSIMYMIISYQGESGGYESTHTLYLTSVCVYNIYAYGNS